MPESTFAVEEKVLEPMLVAGIRTTGRYQDCGKGFAKLGRRCGRHISGKPMMLCYDREYKAEDADYETCFPVRKGESDEEMQVRTLPGGRCLSLMHRGPYDTLHDSYQRLRDYVEEHEIQTATPSREVYHKGPGMIFKGNPQKYLTELQMLIEE